MICDRCSIVCQFAGEPGDCKGVNVCETKQTNADRIRNMTDEELAEMLNHAQGDGYLVGIGQRKMSAYGNWLEWLQQESDGE